MYTQSKHERAVSKKLNSFRNSLVQSTAMDKMLPIQVYPGNYNIENDKLKIQRKL